MKGNFKILFLSMLFITSLHSISQETFYFANGAKINFPFTTINDILDSMKVKHTTVYYGDGGSVYFKKFTNKPLLVILDKPNSLKVKDLIASFNYKKYLYSTSYYLELKHMLNNRGLNKKFLTTEFGAPTNYVSNENNKSTWFYSDYNLSVDFQDSIPISFELMNYNALLKYNLCIFSFSVTGDEYSIGFDINMLNLSSKSIKYVYMTVNIYNPVDDLIGKKTVRGIGPIEGNSNASFSFENVMYSNIATKLSLETIKLQFFDGTTKLLSREAIKSIMKRDWEYEVNRQY